MPRGKLGPLLRLDDVDWRILAELQDQADITNVELARRVGISAPPCLRRVRALERMGIIRGYRTLLDERLLGFEVTAFAFVSLVGQGQGDLLAFERTVADWDIVRECWMLSGDVDFVLRCVAHDVEAFQRFIIEDLTQHPAVATVKTALTIKVSKADPAVPIDNDGAPPRRRAPRRDRGADDTISLPANVEPPPEEPTRRRRA